MVNEDDESLVEHMIDRQVMPQLIAEDLRSKGVRIDVAMANTSPDAEGYEVTCRGCGRTARLAEEPPAGVAVLCPLCVRQAQEPAAVPDDDILLVAMPPEMAPAFKAWLAQSNAKLFAVPGVDFEGIPIHAITPVDLGSAGE